jgi:hypothetical protein
MIRRKVKPLTAADGEMLCVPCHRGESAKQAGELAHSKRLEANPSTKVAAGPPGLARRGFKPAGDDR